MNTESESKFPVLDFSNVETKLCQYGTLCTPWHFEQNNVLDTLEGSLRTQGILLRVRAAIGNSMTLKRPLAPSLQGSAQVKHLEEIESEISNIDATQRLFEALGYTSVLRYEKFRCIWQVNASKVFLDILPFGKFIEIEGTESTIMETAQALGLDPQSASGQNYHQLFKQHREAHDLPPEDSFCFSEKERLALTKKLGIFEEA